MSMVAWRYAELLYFQSSKLTGCIWQICHRICCVCSDLGELAVRTVAPAARFAGRYLWSLTFAVVAMLAETTDSSLICDYCWAERLHVDPRMMYA